MSNYRLNFPAGSQVIGSLANGASTLAININSYGIVPPPPPVGGDLVVTIRRLDNTPNDGLVAPVAIWFTADVENALGISNETIVEPAGDHAAYDPTAVECTYDWNFGDPGYIPVKMPNLPLFLYDLNRAMVKRPTHLFHSPGNKTVSVQVTDAQGRTGVGFFTFGPGGDLPTIADPETHFIGRRVYLSAQGIFPDGAPGVDCCTTVAAAHARIGQIVSGGQSFVRLDLRCGETYTDQPTIGDGRNLYISTYGEGARPYHLFTPLAASRAPNEGATFALTGAADASPSRIIGQNVKGPWDASTETGRYYEGAMEVAGGNGKHKITYHRCKFDGFAQVTFFNGSHETSFWAISDTEITNWSNYGTGLFEGRNFAFLGCDFHQNPDALFGMDHGGGSQNYARFGNRHGPIRLATWRHLYVACCSFFSANGWSRNTLPGRWNTSAPTECQQTFRLSHGGSLVRTYTGFERNSFEGGANSLGSSPTTPSSSYYNCVIESNLFCSSCDTTVPVWACFMGARISNNYFVVPAVNSRGNHSQIIDWTHSGTANPALYSPLIVVNNSVHILATTAQLGSDPAGGRVLVRASSQHTLIENANLYFAPNTNTTIGGGFAPLSTPTLTGFTPRHKGRRWKFPPIGHPIITNSNTPNASQHVGPIDDPEVLWYITCGDAREGGFGDINIDDWISVPYPNFSTVCGGVLGQVTREMCESTLPGGAARFHQLSVFDGVFVAGPVGVTYARPGTTLDAGGNGHIAIAYTDTHIRIQNKTPVAWPASRRFFLWLDLREHHMPFQTGQASPATIPLLIPTTGSTAIVAEQTGLWAPKDMTGAARETPFVIGAFEAAPV
jgi:hypothetical protein